MTCHTSRTSRVRRQRVLAAVSVLAVALLIWTRLRLVSSIPRTVYAEPAGGPATPENGSQTHRPEPSTNSPPGH